jgi:hypothetical protein
VVHACSCMTHLSHDPYASSVNAHTVQVKPILESLPPQAYAALPYALAPVVGNPIAMALSRVPRDTELPGFPGAFAEALRGMLPQLGALSRVLPQDTLVYKLQMLRTGCAYIDRRYGQARPPRVAPSKARTCCKA